MHGMNIKVIMCKIQTFKTHYRIYTQKFPLCVWRNKSLVTWIVDNIKPKKVSLYSEINILYKNLEKRRNCL